MRMLASMHTMLLAYRCGGFKATCLLCTLVRLRVVRHVCSVPLSPRSLSAPGLDLLLCHPLAQGGRGRKRVCAGTGRTTCRQPRTCSCSCSSFSKQDRRGRIADSERFSDLAKGPCSRWFCEYVFNLVGKSVFEAVRRRWRGGGS